LTIRLLPAAGWVYRSPRLGLTTWYATLTAIVAALVAAAAELVAGWPRIIASVCGWLLWCAEALLGRHGGPLGLAGWLFTIALAATVGRFSLSFVRAGTALRARRRAHADALTLLGHQDPDLDVRVIDSHRPAAWLLPGRHGQVVITSAALTQLPPTQLAAVLAHERAHATGRHQILTDIITLLTAIAPGAAILRHAATQVARLVELRADEVAAAQAGRLEVARAIATCAAHAPVAEAPSGALAASGGNALERVTRLVTPPPPLRRATAAVVIAGACALVATPPAIVIASALLPALSWCLTLPR
jgi:beta-lactamase regulating signal transducer with metallopeptidase domain